MRRFDKTKAKMTRDFHCFLNPDFLCLLQTVVATALVMMVAGYDTTAQTMSYMAYELAMNPGKILSPINNDIIG